MRIISLVGIVGIVLLDFAGAIPKASVGGPLALLFLFVVAMLAVGIHEAWSNGRGVLGWITSIVCSVIGGFLALTLGSLIFEAIIPFLDLNGPLATSQHPMRYVLSAGMMALTLFGSWSALQLVRRVG